MRNTIPEERRNQMLLFLPLLILPFLALGFYALGGGKGDAAKDGALAGKGINISLPGAQLKKEREDKYSLYEKAQRDSGSLGSKRRLGAFAALGWDTAAYRKGETKPSKPTGSAAINEAKIRDKLAKIDKQVHAPSVVVNKVSPDLSVNASSAELEKLEYMLKQKQEAAVPDPQLQQLNGMLDKIMQIQKPGLGKAKDSASGRGPLHVVTDTAFKAAPATVEGNQKVLQAGIVRLRLSDSLRLNGLLFPKGQLLFGSCTITNQRLLLEIRNIRLGTAIIPVSLTVFSLDGLAGINAPEAELGEAAGGGAANALDNMEFLGMDQSASTQAAAAGITAAKELIGRKVRRVKVKLKGGYPVLLRNNQSGRP